MSALVSITVATGKEITVTNAVGAATKYTATQTVLVPTHEAARLVAAGLAALT